MNPYLPFDSLNQCPWLDPTSTIKPALIQYTKSPPKYLNLIRFKNPQQQLHDPDPQTPAVIYFHPNGSLDTLEYYQHGLTHRNQAPALVSFYPKINPDDLHEPMCVRRLAFYQNNQITPSHYDELENPSVLCFYPSGKLACIEFYALMDNTFQPQAHFKNPKPTALAAVGSRTDGPQAIDYYEDGSIENVHFFIYGNTRDDQATRIDQLNKLKAQWEDKQLQLLCQQLFNQHQTPSKPRKIAL